MKPVEELRFLILAAQREGCKALNELLKPLEITPSQSEVIRVLYEHEPLSLVELGDLLICETGSPSRLVNRLVETGMVMQTQSSTDSRKSSLTLTADGRKMALRIISIEEQFYSSISASLVGQPIQEVLELLWKHVEGTASGKALMRRKSNNRGEGL